MSVPAKNRQEIADYYDVFNKQLLDDYINGNRRVARALKRVNSVIKAGDRRILDIGCGIGASTFEYTKAHPHLQATGIDISPINIQIAQKLFPSDRLQFSVSNGTDGVVQGEFDVIALLDIYEHVPRSDWSKFNSVLGSLLNERGRIVITTPSALHQEYLKEHHPEGLQIVDETVSLEDVVQLARETRTTVMIYEIASVFRTNDYLHLVLDRQPKRERVPRQSGMRKLIQKGHRALSEGPWARSKRRRQISYVKPLLNKK